ncbi:VOC family protein [Streptomyces sp. CA-251251]|uniref:VOC family protein n=1 Tax=Streptomyces sp. CA-251251 TaxID=3240063 RepID=UPI003D9014F6
MRSPHGGPKLTWSGPPVAPKRVRNRLYFDLAPPAHADPQAEVERLLSLGATRQDSGRGEAGWVAMTDPDGNEFRVLAPA